MKRTRGGVRPTGPRPGYMMANPTNDTILLKTGPDLVHSWKYWPFISRDREAPWPTCNSNAWCSVHQPLKYQLHIKERILEKKVPWEASLPQSFSRVPVSRHCNYLIKHAVLLHWGPTWNRCCYLWDFLSLYISKLPNTQVFPGLPGQDTNVIFILFLHQSILSTSAVRWGRTTMAELKAREAAPFRRWASRQRLWIISTKGRTWAHIRVQKEPSAKSRISSCLCFYQEG